MNLLTLLFRLPLMPIQGLIRLGETIQDQVEQEQHDPASVRRQLEEISEAEVRGEISEPDLARAEAQAVGRLVQPAAPQPAQHGERR